MLTECHHSLVLWLDYKCVLYESWVMCVRPICESSMRSVWMEAIWELHTWMHVHRHGHLELTIRAVDLYSMRAVDMSKSCIMESTHVCPVRAVICCRSCECVPYDDSGWLMHAVQKLTTYALLWELFSMRVVKMCSIEAVVCDSC